MCRHFFGSKWRYTLSSTAAGEPALFCKDPDANELMFVEVTELPISLVFIFGQRAGFRFSRSVSVVSREMFRVA